MEHFCSSVCLPPPCRHFYGSYLTLLGIAARAAYSIGAHRAEVNSRFEVDLCTQRYADPPAHKSTPFSDT